MGHALIALGLLLDTKRSAVFLIGEAGGTSRGEFSHSLGRNEALTRDLDGAGIVMAEVREGLEVGYQLADQPHQLDVAARVALELPARGQLVVPDGTFCRGCRPSSGERPNGAEDEFLLAATAQNLHEMAKLITTLPLPASV